MKSKWVRDLLRISVLLVIALYLTACVLFYGWQSAISPALGLCGDTFLFSPDSRCRALGVRFYASCLGAIATFGLSVLLIFRAIKGVVEAKRGIASKDHTPMTPR